VVSPLLVGDSGVGLCTGWARIKTYIECEMRGSRMREVMNPWMWKPGGSASLEGHDTWQYEGAMGCQAKV
jgi:hypothetical protein